MTTKLPYVHWCAANDKDQYSVESRKEYEYYRTGVKTVAKKFKIERTYQVKLTYNIQGEYDSVAQVIEAWNEGGSKIFGKVKEEVGDEDFHIFEVKEGR